MGDSFKVNLDGLKAAIRRYDSPAVKKAILDIPKARAIAALVGQAIADNFDKEGPGWAPLKGKTLRLSVASGLRKHAERQAARAMGALRQNKKTGAPVIRKKELKGRRAEFNAKVEKILVEGEKHARKVGAEPGRMILQRTGTLKKVATIPLSSAVNKTSGKAGKNIYRVEGTTLIWGVDIVYGKTMNQGDLKRKIPARPFLVVRKEWQEQINDYMIGKILEIIRKMLLKGR